MYLTPKNFTLMLKNVPITESEEEFQEFFDKILKKKAKIYKKIYSYTISEYCETFRK